jgi:hypothetical protein
VEDNSHIDQIIRQKFEGFEPVPPESVWVNIKSRITPPPASSPSITSIILSILTGIAIFVAIITLVLNLRTIPSAEATEHSGIPQMIMPSTNDGPHTDASVINAVSHSKQTVIPVRVPPQTIEKNRLVQAEAQALPAQTKETRAESPAAEINYRQYRGNYNLSLTKYNSYGLYAAMNYPGLSPNTRFGKLTLTDPEYARTGKSNWSIGVFFMPEVTSYPGDSISSKRSYSFQVTPAWHLGNFFIQSGFGLRFTNDDGNLAINYQKYLGSYQDVYLVTFDSTEQGIIPTYYTNTVDVYDSIDHYAISQTKVRYTYLEVPLLFGYSKSFNKINLYIQGGPSLSFMIHKNIPAADYPEEHARIVNVDQQIPTRVNLNWQLMAAAGIGYNFTERVGLVLEPTFRYYLNPEYNQLDQPKKHPYSFGVRAGLIYHFNY